MAGITQKVPNYILGISGQADELKVPGQVVDLVNAVPDVVKGLEKRPGSRLISAITPSTNGKWFSIYTDEDTQYIGQVDRTGVIKIWRCSDGAEIPVDYASVAGTNLATYLVHSEDHEIQTLTINESTFLTNRTKTVAMGTGAGDKAADLVNEVFIELKQVAYGKQYSLDIHDPDNTTTTTYKRATSLKALETHVAPGTLENGQSYLNNGNCVLACRDTVTAPNNLRFQFEVRCAPNMEDGDATSWDDSYQTYARLEHGGEGWQTGEIHSFKTSKNASCKVEIASHAEVTCRDNIARVRPPATASSAEHSISAEEILADMKAALDAIQHTGITATVAGNGLHLTRSTPFNVTTTANELMTIISNEANNIAELPKYCRHNYVVKVVNSGEDQDDYFLKFRMDNQTGANTATNLFGRGVWEECPEPGLTLKFDPDTMPLKLARVNPGTYSINGGVATNYPNGVFDLQYPDWQDRDVGNEDTNPTPSFVGSKINKVLFFRNRLTVLSEENVIMSVANDIFNFWSKTSMAVVDDDPIDIQSSTIFPTILYDGIEVSSGLLVFSSNQQFMVTTDSEALSPKTAKINYLSSYNYNHKTAPFSLGVTPGFISSTGSNARFYEMFEARRDGEPKVLEQSKVINRLFPQDITLAADSRENSVVMFGSLDKADIWGYKYYNAKDDRIQSWFKWELPGTLTYHSIMDDVYFAVIKNGSYYNLEAFDVKRTDETDLIGASPDDYRVHLDTKTDITSAQLGYSTTTKRTGFTKPAGYNSSKQLAVYCTDTGNNIGRYSTASVVGSNIEFSGDWTGHNIAVGYLYEMKVELPKIYVQKMQGNKVTSDNRSSLIIHRLNFTFGSIGKISTTLQRKGRADYTKEWEVLQFNKSKSNTLAIESEHTHTVPAYERNKNLTVLVKSTHPSPATLHSMNWEGEFSTKNYRRV